MSWTGSVTFQADSSMWSSRRIREGLEHRDMEVAALPVVGEAVVEVERSALTVLADAQVSSSSAVASATEARSAAISSAARATYISAHSCEVSRATAYPAPGR